MIVISGSAVTTFLGASSSAWLYGSGSFIGTTAESNSAFNLIQINDGVSDTGTNPLISALRVQEQLVSSSAQGSRIAINGQMKIKATTANKSSGRNAFYVAVQGDTVAEVTDGGTYGAGFGSIDGAEFSAILTGTATNWATVYGTEIAAGIEANSSAQFRSGISLSEVSTGVHRGYMFDSAMQIIGGLNTPGWGVGISFGHTAHPSGFAADSVYLASTPIVNNSFFHPLVARTGIDFTQTAFTEAAVKTPGFSIGHSGNLSIANADMAQTVDGVTIDIPRQITTAVSLATGGSNIVVGELFYASGAIVRVDAVSNGIATAVSLIVPATSASPPVNPVTPTGRSGITLPTFDFTWEARNTLSLNPSGGPITAPIFKNAMNDSLAAAAGVQLGQLYRNGSVIMQRVV